MKITALTLMLMCVMGTAVQASSYKELAQRVSTLVQNAHTETEPIQDIFKDLKTCSDPRGVQLALTLGNFILESCQDDNHLILIADYVEQMVMKIKQGTINNESFIQTLITLIENGIREAPTLQPKLMALRKDITFSDGHSPAKQKNTPAFRRQGSTIGRRASMSPTAPSTKNAGSPAPPNRPLPAMTSSHENDHSPKVNDDESAEEVEEIIVEEIEDPASEAVGDDATRATSEEAERTQAEEHALREQAKLEEKKEKEDKAARAVLAKQGTEVKAQLEKAQKEKEQREAEAKSDAAQKARQEKEKNDQNQIDNQNPGKKPTKTSFTKKVVVTTLVSGIIAMIAMEYLGANPAKKLKNVASSITDTLSKLLLRQG